VYSPTYAVNRAAVGGHAKAVREALIRLGMRRCSLRLVYYQCEARDLHLDYYGALWRWVEALFMANREGAELLVEDFRARFDDLRARRPSEFGWFELVARCEEAHSSVMRDAIRNRDVNSVVARLTPAISAYQELLTTARSRLMASARGVA
jgi:nucleotide-binding universal stress UspA family protein